MRGREAHKCLQLFLAWWKVRLAGEVITGLFEEKVALGLNQRCGDAIQVYEWEGKGKLG